MKMTDWPLYSEILSDIEAAGKSPILDRLRDMFDDDDVSDEERRLDVLFVWRHSEFPEDDGALAHMYFEWTDRTWGNDE
jgi:hypothetical protein